MTEVAVVGGGVGGMVAALRARQHGEPGTGLASSHGCWQTELEMTCRRFRRLLSRV